MRKYRIGFSVIGLILYLVQLAPNIIWMAFPPATDILAQNSSPYAWLDIIEWILGITCIVILILVQPRKKPKARGNTLYLLLAVVLMIAYYGCWIFYHIGTLCDWGILLGLVMTVPLYFLFAGLWLNKKIMIAPSLLFLLCHSAVFFINYIV